MTGRTFNVGGREVKSGITRYNFQEAFQDAILAVKKLQQVIERHFGIKLPTRENAWMYENRLSSINMHERKSFIEKVYEPMMKIADRIMKRGVKDFGLERMEGLEGVEGNTRKKRLPHGEMRQPSSTEMNIWLRSDGHFNCIDIAAAAALNDIDAA